MSTVIPIWVKIVSASAESFTSVKCDPSVTTIDDLKTLVKLRCSHDLEHVDAHRLVIKGADDLTIEEDSYVSDREEGRTKTTAFVVQVPAVIDRPPPEGRL